MPLKQETGHFQVHFLSITATNVLSVGESRLNYRMLWVYQPVMNISAFHPILEWPDFLQGSSFLLLTIRIKKSMNIDGYRRCFRVKERCKSQRSHLVSFSRNVNRFGASYSWSKASKQTFTLWHMFIEGFCESSQLKCLSNSVIVCHWFQSVLYSSFMSLIFCNLWIIILNIFPRIAGHLFCQVLSCTHGMPSSHRLLNSNEENDKFWVSRECIPDGSSWHRITFREGKCQILP